jgi:hypothetical protein
MTKQLDALPVDVALHAPLIDSSPLSLGKLKITVNLRAAHLINAVGMMMPPV